MEETTITFGSKRIAVVTGGNKGIGLEISRQLGSNGVGVILTARDEKRGTEAVEKLKASGFSDVVFHQLDVTDQTSIASLADFLQTQFGKLDILVNNAGVIGSLFLTDDKEKLAIRPEDLIGPNGIKNEYVKQTYETAGDCFKTNYYGIKHLTKALIPLLQKSDSARVVNVSSALGQLRVIPNEEAKKELGDSDSLTEEKVDNLVEGFLEDVKHNLIEAKSWPINQSAYIVSKAALNAYTRVLATKYPSIAINAVSPGFTATDMNNYTGILTAEEAAKGPVKAALLPDIRVSGCYFEQTELSTFE
ncbi:PREDICTED: (+)-neomenthol dehydrogenase [Prunus dulcis]|uniref:Short-chain dehydrogenase/reductase n=1 Tax=Prunus dulcis TaxID=3755 RepID=A0A5E4FRG7_PRUDU|nr:(+)-neomenthol dehydrogenase-like [Prunus dulcis]VVA30053.1 PREDICTED: (+)-neomenthol dehydrogenase [Prunus dulcis]